MLLDWLQAVRNRGLRGISRRRGMRRRPVNQTALFAQAYESRQMLSASPAGSEFQVNTYTEGTQGGPAIAVDADGDYVITWTSVDQDGNNGGVFAQRYNAVGVPQGSEFLVNSFTSGSQVLSAVAMDASGDFIITWSSANQDESPYSIYAQRYNASGVAQGSEFRVNTTTTGRQVSSAVAMDADGDFVIAWQSNDQDGSADGIYAQRFDAAGVAQGSEFQVNTYTTLSQRFPGVAMNAAGDFVITWQSGNQDGSSYGIFAQRYDAAGVAQGGEFQVNTYTISNQRNPAVAMDADGDFVITWDSNLLDGSAYGIFAQRFSAAGVAQSSEFQVNTFTTSHQTRSTVSMDADGDFVITWESSGQDGTGYGVFAQRYDSGGIEQGSEFQVNTYTTSDQRFSRAAMDADGDFIIAWHSYAQDGSGQGIYAQRYDEVGPDDADDAGPIVTDLLIDGNHLAENAQLLSGPMTATVVFSEDLDTTGAGSVTDTSNWQVFRNGVEQPGRIGQITFGLNMATGKYEAELTFAAEPLAGGTYQLVAKETITDVAGNMLDGDRDGTPGDNFIRQFRVSDVVAEGSEFQVNIYTTSVQSGAALAVDGDGDYVIVWESAFEDAGTTGVFAQRYNADGVAQGSEFQVNSYTTGTQSVAAVAMDEPGNFVIAWESVGQDGDIRGIFAQRYDAAGVAQGSEFQVNTYTTGNQLNPAIAMDRDGDFVVTWQSFVQDGSSYGIFAQRYNGAGIAQGNEFQVNTFTSNRQLNASVAMDADGDFVITWESYLQDGQFYGIYAQRYNVAGVAQGSEFQVNTYTTSNQLSPTVGMDADGNFVVSWESPAPTGEDGFGIFARRYDAAGVAQGGEFQVNTYTTNPQRSPAVALDDDGDFVITWNSLGQDGSSYGVYAQRFDAMGTAKGSEFQVNTYTTNKQFDPVVAMDADGDFVIAWESNGQDGSSYGIFAQRYRGNVAPIVDDGLAFSIAENSDFGTSVGMVTATDADPNDTMTYSFSGGNVGKAFDINSATGEIFVNKPYQLDFETSPTTYNLRVAVTDSAGVTRKSTVNVSVTDANDPPEIAGQMFSIAEHSPNGTAVGTVPATDPDASDTLTYSFSGGNVFNTFAIDSMTGEITVAKSARLDFATLSTYNLRVAVTDGGGITRKANVTVHVTDANEAPMISPQTFMIIENSENGTSVGTVVASDPNMTDTLLYAITGGNVQHAFAIHAMTGEITVNNKFALDFEIRPTFNLSVQVTDNHGASRKAVMTINLKNDFAEINTDLFSNMPSLLRPT
ncbi:hypothetical protein GC163_17205 [bacterium]|nr:hypothetical protein [bacterium]